VSIRTALVSSSARRVASAFALVALGTLGFLGLVGGGACTFPEEAAKPDVVFVDPDTAVETGTVLGPPTVFVNEKDEPADLECRGKPRDAGPITDAEFDAQPDAMAPSGQLVPFSADMFAFGTGNTETIAGVKIDVFYGNVMTDDKTPDLVDVTADDKGRVSFLAPAGHRIGFRIKPVVDPDPKKALDAYYEFDEIVPQVLGGVRPFAGMRHAEFMTLTLAVTGKSDFPQFPGTGIFATRVADCQRRYMRNVQVDIVDDDKPATYVKCTEGLCRLYLSDLELPAFSINATSRSGLVAFVGVPVTSATRHVRAVARARLGAGSELTIIGTRELEIHEGAVAFMYVDP
jgi:hypothetical protein